MCRKNGNHKDNFLAFMNYVAGGAPNPLNTQGIPWCRVCQTRGPKFKECMYVQRILSAPTSLCCKLCRSVWHDERDCRSFQLLQEKTIDTYLMKNEEQMQVEQEQPQYWVCAVSTTISSTAIPTKLVSSTITIPSTKGGWVLQRSFFLRLSNSYKNLYIL